MYFAAHTSFFASGFLLLLLNKSQIELLYLHLLFIIPAAFPLPFYLLHNPTPFLPHENYL
ncbi:hypothetical protein C7N43_25135 [Sphingobacteriales bacterium UPWRP_1]|nr:hypothetical protein BVG80_17250 [Sphingobacteriales bacterium TSM_CSM]PSJ74243.1 hypothetical protein C7N43_25135 [Sphingobacteriales bacterium UPWRP_1]